MQSAADWRAIGTAVRLVLTDPGQLAPARAMLEADLAALDRACSRFRDDSEVISVERRGGRQRISPVLAGAVAAALRGAATSDGDVDPTIGRRLSELGYDRDFPLLPPIGAPLRVRQQPAAGWRLVELDEQARTLRLPEGVGLDLGATAKAWAADRAAARVAATCRCGVLVSLGGDIAVAGEAPPGGWPVRVQDVTGHPEDPPDGPSALVAIREGGLATSSVLARGWRRGDAQLHHILDPRTGLPAAPVWRTVSVAAGSCLDANIASLTAIVRGGRALVWLATTGLPARLVAADGSVHTTAGWPAEG